MPQHTMPHYDIESSYAAIHKLDACKHLKGTTILKIVKNLQSLKEHKVNIEAVRNGLIRAHVDSSGNIPDGPASVEYSNSLRDFLDSQADVSYITIKLPELKHEKNAIAPSVLANLAWMIEFDVDLLDEEVADQTAEQTDD